MYNRKRPRDGATTSSTATTTTSMLTTGTALLRSLHNSNQIPSKQNAKKACLIKPPVSAATSTSTSTRTTASCGGDGSRRQSGGRHTAPHMATHNARGSNSTGETEPPLSMTERVWQCKQHELAAEVHQLRCAKDRLCVVREAMLDALERAVAAHDEDMAALRRKAQRDVAQHSAALAALDAREEACRAAKDRALEAIARLQERATRLNVEKDGLNEAIVLERDACEQAQRQLAVRRQSWEAQSALLRTMLAEETRMQDASYGLSGEVKEMVVAMQALEAAARASTVRAMEVELQRRELYSRCEELKGSIRVYCRVKGRSREGGRGVTTQTTTTTPSSSPTDDPRDEARGVEDTQPFFTFPDARPVAAAAETVGADTHDAMSRRCSSSASASDTLRRSDEPGSGAQEDDGDEDEEGRRPRTLCVHQSRANATSTGTCNSTESFTYDRVFGPTATQAEVYRDVEPLVLNAVDGYRVCVFAYGQTGSGKTYTMEGDLRHEADYGITPRALRTVFDRQRTLATEGWSYELSCYFVEIYNDVIRDLLQSPSLYEGATSAASQHIVQHSDDGVTSISNVREHRISNMDDFRALHRQAVQNRRTTKTQLNEHSSRSHSVFVLRIDGTNATIRQRSRGVLCLIDLAGSERTSESGASGRQFREAVNINRSLLDLGKCITALRTEAVAPWRNSRLTYLLQGFMAAKGGKTLMVVTISDQRAHLPESVNSLRFAQRVSETVIGVACKRVTSF